MELGGYRCLDILSALGLPPAVASSLAAEVGRLPLEKAKAALLYIIDQAEHHKKVTNLRSRLDETLLYTHKKLDIETFICSKEYMDAGNKVYHTVKEELWEINSGKYVEVIYTGGIGSGKTTAALYTIAYQLYLLSIMKDPHLAFGLDPASEILFIFQNITETLAKRVSFARFKSMIDAAPYFKNQFPYQKGIESRLVFPKRIEVVPVSGSGAAAIGQNVIGGVIDELNYMAVVENSKQSVDGQTYDQAIEVYNSISRRRKSRFMSHGVLPGILCLVSSRRYPGQFTDLKEEEAKNDPTIYVYDKRVWDIKPEDFEDGGWFRVFVGDEFRRPRILEEGEEVQEQDEYLVHSIPDVFRTDFERDLINALREIAGVSTLARYPFMMDTDAVTSCFGRTPSVFSVERANLVTEPVRLSLAEIKEPHLPRFAHVDLGLTSDSAGIAIGHVPRFVTLKRSDGVEETLPEIVYDGVLEVPPPRGGEINFERIRTLFHLLRKLGLNIRWITYDTFQSSDSLQLLQSAGFVVGKRSVDTSLAPYDFLKAGFYDGRILVPAHAKARKECISLEKDAKKAKVDHPPKGSKDCSDAMAGVAFGLITRREIWSMFKVPISSLPPSIKDILAKEKQE